MKPWNEIYIDRLIDTGKETLGYLHCSTGFDSIALNTLELPWKNNQPNISCIPAGLYPYKKRWSEKNGRIVIELLNVPGRTDIEIHIANYFHELLGCIAVGVGRADIDGNGQMDVTNSKVAFENLMALVPDKGFIHISDNFIKK